MRLPWSVSTDLDIGYRRAVLPACGNDAEMRCEPLGLARLITFSGIGAAMEMVQTEDRILQLFEWTWEFRDIWMDGRGIPDVEDYLPRFNGYSVGAGKAAGTRDDRADRPLENRVKNPPRSMLNHDKHVEEPAVTTVKKALSYA